MHLLDHAEITQATQGYGGDWGWNHTCRLLALVGLIAGDDPYDEEVIWVAAHLHDWGAYRPWARAGVDHVERSVEVAGPWLTERGCPAATRAAILECIAQHAARRAGGGISREAMLLHDADVLDFLGAVGVARDFSKSARDLRTGYEAVLKRRNELPQTLFLERSAELALPRLREMDDFLAAFAEGSFGHF